MIGPPLIYIFITFLFWYILKTKKGYKCENEFLRMRNEKFKFGHLAHVVAHVTFIVFTRNVDICLIFRLLGYIIFMYQRLV